MAVRPELIAELSRQRRVASRAMRGELVRTAAHQWGLSPSHVRKLLRDFESPPGARRGTGERKLDAEHVQEVARIMYAGRDRRGKVRISVLDAIEIAQADGRIPRDIEVDASTWRRRLRELRLDKASLMAPEPAIVRRSLHPNHVHLVDFSVSPQWYFGDDGKVQKRNARAELKALREHRELRYKPEHFVGRRHLWRYLLVDHTSGYVVVRYYYSPGENPADLADFLFHAWSDSGAPFCGVPKMVLADQGAPFRAGQIQTLLAALDVELELHAPGNAKASGAVEAMHRHWEDRFDARLRLTRAGSLQELNEKADAFGSRFNGTHVHSRHGMSRSAAWCRIRSEQLRMPPTRRTFMGLATRKPETRRVDSYLRISWRKTFFQLEGDVGVGETVTVVEVPYSEDDVTLKVWSPREEELQVTELAKDDWGFSVGGRDAIIGARTDAGERIVASHPDTPAQRLERQLSLDPVAVADAFGGPEMSRLDDRLFMRPKASGVVVPEAAAARLSSIDVRQRAIATLGRPLRVDEADSIKSALPMGGLPEDQLDDFLEEVLHLQGAKTA